MFFCLYRKGENAVVEGCAEAVRIRKRTVVVAFQNRERLCLRFGIVRIKADFAEAYFDFVYSRQFVNANGDGLLLRLPAHLYVFKLRRGVVDLDRTVRKARIIRRRGARLGIIGLGKHMHVVLPREPFEVDINRIFCRGPYRICRILLVPHRILVQRPVFVGHRTLTDINIRSAIIQVRAREIHSPVEIVGFALDYIRIRRLDKRVARQFEIVCYILLFRTCDSDIVEIRRGGHKAKRSEQVTRTRRGDGRGKIVDVVARNVIRHVDLRRSVVKGERHAAARLTRRAFVRFKRGERVVVFAIVV